MKKKQITIKSDPSSGNLYAFDGNITLFSFAYRDVLGSWCFWVPGRGQYDPHRVYQRPFPWPFFKDLCRAVSFVLLGETLCDADSVEIVSGANLVE